MAAHSVVVLLCALMALALSGCGGSTPSPAPTPSPTPAPTPRLADYQQAWGEFLAAMGETDEAEQSRLLGLTVSNERVVVGSKWYTSAIDYGDTFRCGVTCSNPFTGSKMLRAFGNYIVPAEFDRVEELLDTESVEGSAHGFAIWKGKDSLNLTFSQFALFLDGNYKIRWHGLFRVGGDKEGAVEQTLTATPPCDDDQPTCKLWAQWKGDQNITETVALFGDGAKIFLYTDDQELHNYTGAAESFAAKLFTFSVPNTRLEQYFWETRLSEEPLIRIFGFAVPVSQTTPDSPLPNFHSFVMTKGDLITHMYALYLSPPAGSTIVWA